MRACAKAKGEGQPSGQFVEDAGHARSCANDAKGGRRDQPRTWRMAMRPGVGKRFRFLRERCDRFASTCVTSDSFDCIPPILATILLRPHPNGSFREFRSPTDANAPGVSITGQPVYDFLPFYRFAASSPAWLSHHGKGNAEVQRRNPRRLQEWRGTLRSNLLCAPVAWPRRRRPSGRSQFRKANHTSLRIEPSGSACVGHTICVDDGEGST